MKFLFGIFPTPINLLILSTLAIVVFYSPMMAQDALIYEERVTMKTYMYSDPNPVPDMNRSYPYSRFDGYTRHGKPKKWKMVILENDFIKVFITPEIGGKIWGAVEKSTGGEFLYYNDVVKFRDVALRGPWTSGGLEYNFGLMSHVSTCSTPQDYILKKNDDGSVSCVIGAIDLHTRTKWNVEINLQKDKAFVETIASWYNTGPVPVTYYHYMNAAAKADGNLEFIYPGSHYIGHGGRVGEWPVEDGRKISYYENNNFGSYKSYHVLNAYSNYMGGYWHEDEFGFGHFSAYDERPGKKLWIWGLSPQGMIWEDLLTDSKGQYIEFQSGKLFNQAMVQSSYTPFKHREFIPHDSDIMREIWFPLKKTGGMKVASRHGVLNVLRNGNSVEVRLSPLQPIKEELKVSTGKKVIKQVKVDLKTLDLYVLNVSVPASESFRVELGGHLLIYTSVKDDLILNRPLEANEDFNWNSAIGLYTKGLELEKQLSYFEGNAYSKAHEYYMKSLEKDPAYAPALNRLGLSYFRQIKYEKALEYINRSLAIDTYDPEANFFYGLINTKLNRIPDAKSGFSIAAQSTSYRTAAYTELARLFLLEKNNAMAESYIRKALTYNKNNMSALEMLAIIARKRDDKDLSAKVLKDLYELDETSSFVVSERIKKEEIERGSLNRLITNELPEESYLRLALKYYHYGLIEESIRVLKEGPDHVKILLWLAFLDKDNRDNWLNKCLERSPEFVFPFREETLSALKELMKTNDNWKLKYYASLIYWKKGLPELARILMNKCGEEPDYAPFYLSKAKLFTNEPEIKKEAILKADSMDPVNWRVKLARIDQLMVENNFEEATRIAKNTLDKKPEMAELGIRYGMALLKSERYVECVQFLESFYVLPYEGANEGRNIYHEACIRAAYDEMQKKNYKNALIFAEKAKLWPLNLGAGRPYDVDERLDNYIIAYCYQKLDRDAESEEYLKKVAGYELKKDIDGENVSLYLRIQALNKLNRDKEAGKLIAQIKSASSDNDYIRWIQSKFFQDNSALFTENIRSKEKQKSPVNNDFILLEDLLDIIE